MTFRTALWGAAAAAVAICSSALAGGPGDNPNTAIPLTGDQSYMYDSSQFQTTQGSFSPTCFGPASPAFVNDVFICWTATYNGMVTITTCGGSPAGTPDGTRIALWQGCNALHDTEPFCCSDTACNSKDASIFCEVECGHNYLIRIGLDPGTPNLVKKVTFTQQGQPCGGGGNKTEGCAECCQQAPQIANFTSPVAVGTSWEDGTGEFVVHVFDVSQWSSQAPGPWAAPVYENPSWTKSKLGSVFGVTLDTTGNIYVAHTAIYQSDTLGTIPLGGAGAIYKLDSITGNPTTFTKLPNIDPCAPATTCAPGLGNLTYSCFHDCIYASNFDDGRIYRILMDGTKVEAYDFGDNAIESALPDPNDGPGFAAMGKLVWGVGVTPSKLFFSVYREDQSFPNAAASNEIWSIGLAPNGAFIAGAPTLEITMPDYGTGSGWSNPVADIAFDAECCMFVAERSMSGPGNVGYHVSRLMKFCVDPLSGRYMPSGDTFETGVAPALVNSAAGGVSLDLAPGALVYATSDAMKFGPTYYGIIGLPQTGGVNLDGLLIDMNGFTGPSDVDKSFQGSVEVACVAADPPCLEVSQEKILCPLDSTNPCYTWTFTLTNHSGFSVKYVTIPLHPFPNSPITLNPNVINLLQQDGSLLDDGESTTITVQICGGVPGDEFCINVALVTPTFQECCFEEVCLTLPECDCGQLRDQHIKNLQCTPNADGTGTVAGFTYCFTLDNLTGYDKQQVIFIPTDTRQAYFAKDFFFLPPLGPGQSISMCVEVENAIPGEEFCFYVLLQHPGSDCCCAFEKCIMVPECPAGVNNFDLNNDGSVDGGDLGIVLSQWGSCAGASCSADFNNDNAVDGSDLGALLAHWHTN